MKRLLAFAFGALISTSSFANNEYTAQTVNGRKLTFTFHTDTITMDTHSLTVCVSSENGSTSSVTRLGLWMKMPGHEHGSSPTVVHPAKNDCSIVNEINFTMPGNWQLHVRLKDGDSTGKHPLEVMVEG